MCVGVSHRVTMSRATLAHHSLQRSARVLAKERRFHRRREGGKREKGRQKLATRRAKFRSTSDRDSRCTSVSRRFARGFSSSGAAVVPFGTSETDDGTRKEAKESTGREGSERNPCASERAATDAGSDSSTSAHPLTRKERAVLLDLSFAPSFSPSSSLATATASHTSGGTERKKNRQRM